MLHVFRRVWIASGRHRVGVAPAAIAALNPNLTATLLAHRQLRRAFGLVLSGMHTARALAARRFDRPTLRMLGDVSVWHHSLPRR
ncbi:hypothetical protein Xaut_0678 [Xanthobacter versatilis]|uniref:Uncharacterized protein n=1 Tax=Xanthobacter autotrophicus (strain ATCC BAA-1158 / Py2) TaxID=78245 RepID=A7ID37_XANP2|nr:hypothetical protein Xaut_0678 [Xanthobacter autotrophicus Py2]